MKIEYDDILLYYYLTGKDKDGKTFRHSKYDGIFTLRQFLNGKKGNQSYIEDIKKLRETEYHSKEYNDIKERLPLFWLGGKSLSGYRRKSDITTVYNIFSIDIDKQDNEELFNENGIDVIKYDLFEQIPSCFCAMTSCGGQGVVLYLLLDNVNIKNEKQYFTYWEQEFLNSGIIIDAKTNDILSRARYISYDPDILMKNEVEPFKLPKTFIKEYRNNKKKEFNESYEINSEADIKYLDNVRRYKYCYTLKKLFGREIAERITKEIYDKFYNGTSDRTEAYHHIEASCANNSEYIDENIYKELVLLGIVKEDKKQKKDESLLNIELKENEPGNEWMSDKKEEIINFIKDGVNLIISPTGSGKNEFCNSLVKMGYSVCVVEPYTSIVEGKYDKKNTNIAAGEGNYIDNECLYTATNYYKFIKWIKSGCKDFLSTKETIDNNKESDNELTLFENVVNKTEKNKDKNKKKYKGWDFLVIDESHKIGMEDFRANQMLDFIEAVNLYEEMFGGKIILQTATPSNEIYFFNNIKKTICIKKDVKKFVQIHYTHTKSLKNITKDKEGNIVKNYENNIINAIQYYTNIYREEDRKVYIYWGSGAIDKMKLYQKLENELNGEDIAIYHKRNKGNDDMKYITENRMMGKYNILMTSCFFSVGCDLNDEQNTAIIIIGNNTYQEDEQVIGRFRRSKNIKVNIILDDNYIEKYDVSEILDVNVKSSLLIGKSKTLRHNSLINKDTSEARTNDAEYIKCSKYYFSDLNRKFNYYKERNYNLVNEINEEIIGNKKYYEICERTKDGIMPIVYLINNNDELIKMLIDDRRNKIDDIKEQIYDIVKNNNTEILEEERDKSKDRPILQDWLDAMIMIKNHYNINTMINELTKEAVLSLSKREMNDLIKFSIKIFKREFDLVEFEIVKELIKIFDKIDKKKYFEIYLALYYCLWCEYFEEENNFTYDMMQISLKYPVYKEWKKRILNIVKINREVREYILNYKEKELFGCSYEFLKDIIIQTENNDIINKIEIFKNKYIHKSYYKQFFEYIIKINYGEIKEKNKLIGQKGGKKGKSIEINGIIYNTVTEAAEKLGITRQAIYKRIKHENELQGY